MSASLPKVRLNDEPPRPGHLPPLASRALVLLRWMASLFLHSTGHCGPGSSPCVPGPRSCPEAPGPACQWLGARHARCILKKLSPNSPSSWKA